MIVLAIQTRPTSILMVSGLDMKRVAAIRSFHLDQSLA